MSSPKPALPTQEIRALVNLGNQEINKNMVGVEIDMLPIIPGL